MRKPRQLTPKLEEALDSTGLPWEVQPGRKHFKLTLGGRFVASLHPGDRGSGSPILERQLIQRVSAVAQEMSGRG